MNRTSCGRCLGLLVLLNIIFSASFTNAQLWRHLVPGAAKPGESPVQRVAMKSGPPPSASRTTVDTDFSLTQQSGPWLIVAASFSGKGAEDQARALAQELRTRHRLVTYVHQMNFKLDEQNPGRGVDEYGAPIRRRYQRGEEVRELAVLVGDFPSIDDPEAQKTLERIKSLEPDALKVDVSQTTQTMAEVRRWQDALMEKIGKPRKRGPMSQAFLTRNPLLPREFFVPKGVDPFVARMNEGVEYSLLDCPGKYTMQVATFRGKSVLQTGIRDDQATQSFWSRRKNEVDPLVEAAENAHLLTLELRKHGWEAYEFHDRTESIVTIGSFAQVAQLLPNGQIQPLPEVDRILKTFGAGYDTPADPLSGIGNDPANQRLVDEHEQQIKLQISSQQAQIVTGLNPKHVKILKGSGKNVRVERIIPMDIQPKAIEVPRRSISSAYSPR